MDNALVTAAAEGDLQTFFAEDKSSVNEYVNGRKQFLLCFCALHELLEGVAGVGCHLVAFVLQKLCQLCKGLRLCEGLTA